MGAKSKPFKRDEIIGALTLVMLFFSVMAGREVGNFYASYDEMKSLKVLFKVTEEEMSGYLRDVLQGGSPELGFGLTITLPAVETETKLVTETPDYVRRWLISVTLSPVVVRQPSVSDVEFELLVEDETIVSETFTFPKQKVPYLGLVDRGIELSIGDVPQLRSRISEAVGEYSGEVKVEVRGRVRAHLWFLETWLPFSTTRYPLVDAPHIVYDSSEWRSFEGVSIASHETGQPTMVSARFRNPTRVHSLTENVTCTILRDGNLADMVTKEVRLAPGTDGVYVFLYTPPEPGDYSYRLTAGSMALTASDTPVLRVEG
ncbi:hypothetical protein JXL21_10360 [Candidatus Bathyarchaeota archaeon]|nr:hypothetical protein [Candidatus Bathyarchaeota archaeon]